MENLKKANPDYFAYRCHYTHDDMIDGVVWKNGTSRAMLLKHDQRGFFDIRVSKCMNTLGYVYCTWIGIDADNRFFLGCEAVLYGETDELYEFLFTDFITQY